MTKKTTGLLVLMTFILVVGLVFGAYSFAWFETAKSVKSSYVAEISSLAAGSEITPPIISGYPGKMVLRKDIETISSDEGTLVIHNLFATSWPFPNAPVDILTGEIELISNDWLDGLSFDSFSAHMVVSGTSVVFEDSSLRQNDFEAKLTGSVDLSDPKVAIPDLLVTLANHEDLLATLTHAGIIEENAARFIGFGMSALMNKDTQKIEVPIYAKNGMINMGPFPIMRLPESSTAGESSTALPKRVKPVIPDPNAPLAPDVQVHPVH